MLRIAPKTPKKNILNDTEVLEGDDPLGFMSVFGFGHVTRKSPEPKSSTAAWLLQLVWTQNNPVKKLCV